VQEAGWTPGSVWTGAENLAATGIRSPDRPARSQSLYRLSCRGPLLNKRTFQINTMHVVIRKFQHCKFQTPSEVTAILCSHSLNLFKICINIMFSSLSWSSHCLFSKSFLQKKIKLLQPRRLLVPLHYSSFSPFARNSRRENKRQTSPV